MPTGDDIADLLGGGGESAEAKDASVRGNGPEQPRNASQLDIVQVNDPKDAPTVFSDGLLFATLVNGGVRLQFAEYVPHATNGPNPGLKTRVVANVVMPLEGYRGMMDYLSSVNGPYIFGEEAADAE
ncbi:hypothetical protein [Qipengyuania marisflavi]|uniref:Uncharacterized protein n=1 Tax=Qipengyuania marisflavi TaxID=2486356 RepID=A0A5S3P2X1_9SPHN|nr:hypothetical protein [Qipengyuania marisflavi]TMM47269.1 hypothetical protein FEV51_09350 [Qipengyuania marisflavi]